MKTMRRIDQPLQFEQPSALENSLLEIQQHYQQIVQHIEHFDNTLVKRREEVAEFLHLDRAGQEALYDFWRLLVDDDDGSLDFLGGSNLSKKLYPLFQEFPSKPSLN